MCYFVSMLRLSIAIISSGCIVVRLDQYKLVKSQYLVFISVIIKLKVIDIFLQILCVYSEVNWL